MSLFGNWPPPCFCCCCCCWNSLSLKSWLWLHFFGQRILWKPPSPQKQMNTPQAHTGKKSASVTAAPAAVHGRPKPVTQPPEWVSPNPVIHFLPSGPSPLLTGSFAHWLVSLKVIFLPILSQIYDSFNEERVALFSYLEKKLLSWS